MKLIASLVTIATGVAVWIYMKKNGAAPARLELPKVKAPKIKARNAKSQPAKASRAERTRKIKKNLPAANHKRNGMTTHAA